MKFLSKHIRVTCIAGLRDGHKIQELGNTKNFYLVIAVYWLADAYAAALNQLDISKLHTETPSVVYFVT